MKLEVQFGQPQLNLQFGNPSLGVSTGTPVVREVIGGSLPVGGSSGDIIVKHSSSDFDCSWVAPANEVEENNTLPITAAAVYTTVGNINALLATI